MLHSEETHKVPTGFPFQLLQENVVLSIHQAALDTGAGPPTVLVSLPSLPPPLVAGPD